MFEIPFDIRVQMDRAHIELIRGVALALKPYNILELGIGSGAVTEMLVNCCTHNEYGQVTAVDSWLDWNGVQPRPMIHPRLTVVTATEEAYVTGAAELGKKFDLVVSDADHFNAHKWFHKTMSLVSQRGFAFFHDVTNPEFPNLENMIEYGFQYQSNLFNVSSRRSERCERGLLMVSHRRQ
jgi:predicted O-methyltransferase YrrM